MQTPEFVDGHHREIFVPHVRLPHLFRFLRPRCLTWFALGLAISRLNCVIPLNFSAVRNRPRSISFVVVVNIAQCSRIVRQRPRQSFEGNQGGLAVEPIDFNHHIAERWSPRRRSGVMRGTQLWSVKYVARCIRAPRRCAARSYTGPKVNILKALPEIPGGSCMVVSDIADSLRLNRIDQSGRDGITPAVGLSLIHI